MSDVALCTFAPRARKEPRSAFDSRTRSSAFSAAGGRTHRRPELISTIRIFAPAARGAGPLVVPRLVVQSPRADRVVGERLVEQRRRELLVDRRSRRPR